jgi:hypothetical protein
MKLSEVLTLRTSWEPKEMQDECLIITTNMNPCITLLKVEDALKSKHKEKFMTFTNDKVNWKYLKYYLEFNQPKELKVSCVTPEIVLDLDIPNFPSLQFQEQMGRVIDLMYEWSVKLVTNEIEGVYHHNKCDIEHISTLTNNKIKLVDICKISDFPELYDVMMTGNIQNIDVLLPDLVLSEYLLYCLYYNDCKFMPKCYDSRDRNRDTFNGEGIEIIVPSLEKQNQVVCEIREDHRYLQSLKVMKRDHLETLRNFINSFSN